MKQFIDFIPLILFFITYKMEPRTLELAGHSLSVGGVYSATAVLIGASLVVYGLIFATQRKLEKGQWITLLAWLMDLGLRQLTRLAFPWYEGAKA